MIPVSFPSSESSQRCERSCGNISTHGLSVPNETYVTSATFAEDSRSHYSAFSCVPTVYNDVAALRNEMRYMKRYVGV